jgi:hypothetical protein
MTRTLLLASACIAGLLAATQSEAASESKTIDGKQLELRTNCVKKVEIEPQADLAGRISIEATADSSEELTPLAFISGDTARIERKGNCESGIFKKPTLVLTVKVPAGMPLDIRDGGSGDYAIGSVGGPLKARLAGSGNLTGGDFTSVDLEVSGSSDVKFDKITGPTGLSIHGSGNVKIGTGTIPSLTVSIAGSGDVEMGAGEIGSLAVSISGSGDVRLHATAQTASLMSSGSGKIAISKVTGSISQRSSGSGEIRVGG